MSQRDDLLLRRLPPPAPGPRRPLAPLSEGKVGFSLSNLNPLARQTLTVSLEGTSLRLVLIRGEVRRWHSLPLNPRIFRNGFIVDVRAASQTLAQGLSQARLKRGRVVGALPGLQATARLITFPVGVRGNANTIVARELRRLIPVAEETNYLFWQVLPSPGGQLQAYAVTVPKAPVLAIVETLRGAGLRPRSLDLKPLALARAVGRPEAIIANGESNSLDVVVVTEGVPAILRNIFLGDAPPSPEMAQTRLLEELNGTISFYNNTHRDRPLSPEVPIFLTGEMALNPSLRQEVINATGRPVPPLDSPLPCPSDFPLALFMVNLGLAVKKQ